MQAAIAYLVDLLRENGWPCAVSKELGNFRGPGRKDDPCPFANLAMLKALSQVEALRDSPACRVGAETLLTLWRESAERHPYMFFMGNDFRKLKVPFIWYDLLHVLDVLTRFAWLKDDPACRKCSPCWRARQMRKASSRSNQCGHIGKTGSSGRKSSLRARLTLYAWRVLRRCGYSYMQK